MKQYGSPHTSRRPEMVPVLDVGTGARPTRTDAIVAGFYVNWADNSFASLKRNYDKLDWVIGEWAFIPQQRRHAAAAREAAGHRAAARSAGRDATVALHHAEQLRRHRAATRRRESSTRRSVRRFLGNPVARANAIRQLRTAVLQYGLAGTTLDMENFDASLQAQVLGFARELHDAMHSIGRLSTQAIAVSDDDAYIRRAARVNDKLFPMLFDEHYGSGDPGPVSSQRVLRHAGRALRAARRRRRS